MSSTDNRKHVSIISPGLGRVPALYMRQDRQKALPSIIYAIYIMITCEYKVDVDRFPCGIVEFVGTEDDHITGDTVERQPFTQLHEQDARRDQPEVSMLHQWLLGGVPLFTEQRCCFKVMFSHGGTQGH